MVPPGAPLTYFNDGGGCPTEVHILYPKKSQLQYCLPKKIPTFFSIPKKIPQCFCISKFYYLSSGKLKHASFIFGFGQKQNYKLRSCYFWFELMKNTITKKIPVLFSRPQKIPASFKDPKKSLLAKMSDPKKSFGPPRHWNMWVGPLRDGLNYLKVISSLRFISSLNLFTNNKALKCYNLPVPLALLWSWANSILLSTPAWTLERDKCMALANCSSSSSLIPCPNKQTSSTSS